MVAALVGAGHLVGLSVGMAMLTGLLIAWAIAVPILTSMQPAAEARRSPRTLLIWRTQVRFIGAGAIAIAAIYTLATLAKPVVGGSEHARRLSVRERRGRSRPRSFALVDSRAHGDCLHHRVAGLTFARRRCSRQAR